MLPVFVRVTNFPFRTGASDPRWRSAPIRSTTPTRGASHARRFERTCFEQRAVGRGAWRPDGCWGNAPEHGPDGSPSEPPRIAPHVSERLALSDAPNVAPRLPDRVRGNGAATSSSCRQGAWRPGEAREAAVRCCAELPPSPIAPRRNPRWSGDGRDGEGTMPLSDPSRKGSAGFPRRPSGGGGALFRDDGTRSGGTTARESPVPS